MLLLWVTRVLQSVCVSACVRVCLCVRVCVCVCVYVCTTCGFAELHALLMWVSIFLPHYFIFIFGVFFFSTFFFLFFFCENLKSVLEEKKRGGGGGQQLSVMTPRKSCELEKRFVVFVKQDEARGRQDERM